MVSNRALAFTFAVMILAAHCHCVMEHAWALDAAGPPRGAASLPVAPAPADCENESGCICKGATLAVVVDLPPVEVCFDLFDGFISPYYGEVAIDQAAGLLPRPPDEHAPVLSAQTLRALLQSYLI
jgi:hypothetical protein